MYIFEYIGTRVVALCKRTGRGEIFQRRLSSEGKMFLRWWQDERISGTRQQTPRDAWTTNVVWVVTCTWHVASCTFEGRQSTRHRRLFLQVERLWNTFFPFAPTRDTAWPPPGIFLLHIPRTLFSLCTRRRELAFRRTSPDETSRRR